MVAALDSYWITWFPGALLATLGILALVYKGIEAFIKIRHAAEAVARIEHEFSPNSGASLRDAVDAIKGEQGQVRLDLSGQTRVMSDHIAADAKAFDRQDRVNTRVEATLDRIEDHVRGK